ncbi:CRISPR-associated protein Cas4 [Halomicrococcus sp. SG-WS-1]|uniref:CRISPR-associated protein Cas4 n=1 Tax=Halomicrococcus sp. SG-WS-1 TaxID=3439057 RepID=UPI003F7A72D1
MSKRPFYELETAAYCPRKLYYQRRDTVDVPDRVVDRRELAFEYDRLLDASPTDLADLPLELSPEEFRANLERAADGDAWSQLCTPDERERLVEGKDCRGVVHKVLDRDAPVPSMVFTGAPPNQGVWEPQSVRAVAAAKALAWEHETAVDRAFVEYPAYGIVREIDLTTRRKAAYRRALRTARAIDGPPPRLRNDAKCDACEYRAECGVKTRSLRSLLG